MSLDSIRRSVSDFFFAPMSPTTLAVARVMIFGLLLWKSLSRAWPLLADWPSFFLLRTAATGIPYVTAESLSTLTVVFAVLSLLGMLGWFTRFAAAGCFVVLYLFNAIDGGPWDSGWLLFSFLLLLVCSRSSDALRLPFRRSDPQPEDSWEYRWPLRVIQITFALVYFEAGMAKLYLSGLDWVNADVLPGWYFFHLWIDTHYHTWGSVFIEHPWLSTASAIATLIFEVGFISVLFWEPLKWIFVPGMVGMHVAIGLTLNIWFTSYFFLLWLFFDWSKFQIPAFLRRAGRAVEPPSQDPSVGDGVSRSVGNSAKDRLLQIAG